MAIYKCSSDLLGFKLKLRDEVWFLIENELFCWIVKRSRLASVDDLSNTLFAYYEIRDKKSFFAENYGYTPIRNEWDDWWLHCKLDDYAALTRSVLSLYEIIEEIPKKLAETSTTLFID